MNWPDPFQHAVQLGLLAFTAVALGLYLALGRQLEARVRRALLATMAAVALLSGANYFRMGQLHGYGVWGNASYHYHDIYHYALGAKYYPELGYERLYDCTWVALDEWRAEGVPIPKVPQIRDLSSPNLFFNPATRRAELSEACHGRFSDARWTAFRGDVKGAWLDRGWEDKWWHHMLMDLGFNPPPTWSALAHPLAHTLPLDGPWTLNAWPWLDVFFVFGIGGALVWWAFGPWALFAYITVLGTNYIASYRWTGGSFCRQLWFAFLVWGVCLLQLKRHTAAGVALALSVCMRLFPALFVLGALIPLVRAARADASERSALIRLGVAGLATTAATVGLSLVLFDASLWPEFFDKMHHHGNTYFTWHVGFKKWAVWASGELGNPARYRDLAPTQTEAFQVYCNQIYASGRLLFDPLRAALCAAAAGLAWRRTPAQAAWLVGAVWMFCLSIPANYYWVHLALFPAVFWDERGGEWAGLRMWAFFAMLASISLSTFLARGALDQNGWINSSILAFLVVMLVATGLEGDRSARTEPASV